MSNTADDPEFPLMSAMWPIAEKLEVAQTTDEALRDIEIDGLLRHVEGKRAIIKVIFQGRPAVIRLFLQSGDDTAEREWAEMQRLWPEMNKGRFRIAEPLHLSACNQLVVIAYIPGTPFFKYLRALPEKDRTGWWPAPAKWLRRSSESTETWGAETHGGWLTRAARASATQPFRELRQIESAILGEIERIGRLFQGKDWRNAICHGDFHPNNLILKGDRLTAIDTGGSCQMPIYKDMARFLVHMGRRDVILSGDRYLGVDRQGIAAFADIFDLTQTEECLILPFMIGCEALIRVETKELSRSRIKRAIKMSTAMLGDLKQVDRL